MHTSLHSGTCRLQECFLRQALGNKQDTVHHRVDLFCDLHGGSLQEKFYGF